MRTLPAEFIFAGIPIVIHFPRTSPRRQLRKSPGEARRNLLRAGLSFASNVAGKQPKVGNGGAGLLVQPGGGDGISYPTWHQVAVRAVMGPVVKVPAATPHRVLRTDHRRSFRGLAMAIREQNVNPVTVPIGRPLAVAEAVICGVDIDRKSTRLNSSHLGISYAVF